MFYRKFPVEGLHSNFYFVPHMEYASAVWDPYLTKDIKLIQKKFVPKIGAAIISSYRAAISIRWLIADTQYYAYCLRSSPVTCHTPTPYSDAKIVTTSRGAGIPHSLLLALPGPTVLNTHIFLEHSQDGTR